MDIKRPPAQISGAPGLLDDQRWETIQSRQVGEPFVYAVTSTGVYCRPGCPSRLPLRANVRFFGAAADARLAGFRACKRCRPDESVALSAACSEQGSPGRT